jgi:RNA recognition motif-containing protein
MSKKIFVGGLAWTTNSDGLNAAFASYGEISEAIVITDRDTGRSRGFGFVTFNDDEAAQRAVELNGTELDGRTIRVDVATEKRGGSGGGGGGGRFGGGGGGRDRY